MKNVLKGVLFLALGGMIICSCSSDNGGGGSALGGSFTANGTTYNLDKGFIVDEGGEYDIILTSSGISPVPDEGDEFTGTGDAVSIIVISTSATSFEPGSFTFDASGNKVPGTIEDASALINIDFDTETVDTDLEGTGGAATVTLDGDTYTITFNITTSSGSIEGNFTGMLTELED